MLSISPPLKFRAYLLYRKDRTPIHSYSVVLPSPGEAWFSMLDAGSILTFSQKSAGRVVKYSRTLMSQPIVRVLVVDDFEPFRRLVCSMLGNRSTLQIVGEASDGLEAVRQAEELKPDLILLDIGLPRLNGIEAALQIRKLAPQSKIIFVSQEFSPEMVRAAFRLGAWGYVVKAKAGSDLLAAVESVLLEKHFVNRT
jgi:CheY-like chemotaxis protein